MTDSSTPRLTRTQRPVQTASSSAHTAMAPSTTVAYALFNLQKRGRLFLGAGVKVYKGQIVGEHGRDIDLAVNPAKGKQLTNMRAPGPDENGVLAPPVNTTVKEVLTYFNPL